MNENGHRLFKLLFFGLIGVGLLSCRLPVMLYAALVQEATATPTITQTGTPTTTATVTVTLSPTITQAPPPPPTLMVPTETALPVPTQPRQPTQIIYTVIPYGLSIPSLQRPNANSGISISGSGMRPWYEWLPVTGAYTYMIWVWRLDIQGNKVEMLLNEQHQGGNICSTYLCQLHPDVTLTINKNYVWQVQAYGAAGYSPLSELMRFKADTRYTDTPGATATVTRTHIPEPTVPSPTVPPVPYPSDNIEAFVNCGMKASAIKINNSGKRAYLISGTKILVFNITNPVSPSLLASNTIDSGVITAINGIDYSRTDPETVYLAAGDKGIVKVVGITNVAPALTYDTTWTSALKGNALSVAIAGDLLLVGSTTGTLSASPAIHVFDPTTLIEKSYSSSGADNIYSMMVYDGVDVYASTHSVSFKAWHCSGQCTNVGSKTVPIPSYGSYTYTTVDISNVKKYTIVAAYAPNGGLKIYDVTTSLTDASLIGSFICNDCYARNVVVSGNYAYPALEKQGLVVVSISTPSLPKPIYYYNATQVPDINVVDIDKDDNYIYLALNNNICFRVISIP